MMGLFEITYEDEILKPLHQKISEAVSLIKKYEVPALDISEDGYYVAFSGGKDSIVMERLFKMSGVKYQAFYNNTTIDPPELIYFIRKNYPDVKWNSVGTPLPLMMKRKSNGPPTRIARWCCELYKEQGGDGKLRSIGVRSEESARRKKTWSVITTILRTNMPILAPILYWTEKDIWQFISDNNMPYCSLYDEGFKRIGCIGCPMSSNQAAEFKRYPRYEALWRKGFQVYWDTWKGVPRKDGKDRWVEKFTSVEQLWDWWVSGKAYEGDNPDCQLWLW